MKNLEDLNFSVLEANQKPYAEIVKIIERNLSGTQPTVYVIKLTLRDVDK